MDAATGGHHAPSARVSAGASPEGDFLPLLGCQRLEMPLEGRERWVELLLFYCLSLVGIYIGLHGQLEVTTGTGCYLDGQNNADGPCRLLRSYADSLVLAVGVFWPSGYTELSQRHPSA